ncbi:aminoglycoside phosphotransferase family protein [Nocardioides dongxiaopingii]|uniref:aminoglycoside phosphotransferase family protein n=1 Tax=Nocardioides dongxiaopingii TaxID=2576036 RepID=UPI0010C764BD|nr:aminoglycoside phosphotransferase family protein [Nocardioides dongxiaopingii]
MVSQLLRDQAPDLADLGIRAIPAPGSSNWVFRIGETLAIRLPRSDDCVADLQNEVQYLPRLPPHLPTAVPDIVATGQPSSTFPRPWAVVSWLPGDPPLALADSQQQRLAESLGRFLRALHEIDASNVPPGPGRWGYRCGEPVNDTTDRWVEQAAAELMDLFDPNQVSKAWRRLREVSAATQAACWVHTDLSEENLLVHSDGRLAGVIDFGGVGVGDRSVDLLYAWSMFERPARDVLRLASGVDDQTWTRARAWAFAGPGPLTIANYRDTMPARVDRLTSMVVRVAAEVDVELR